MLAQITFRSDDVFTDRFGRELADRDGGGFELWQRFEVERYLDHHGDKLVRRFDANSYLVLSKAMDLHDVSRGRGSLEAAMARIKVPTLSIGIWSDQLYPSYQQKQIRELLHGSRPPGRVRGDRLAARPRQLPHRHRPGGRGRVGLPRRRGEGR